MIFGRKKPTEPDIDDVETGADETSADSANDTGGETTDAWTELDAQDWRSDGPFDITEVDLEADDIVRLDLGSLILTPFEGMQMQLQVDEATKDVQALLVMKEDSAIEIALFAAPKSSAFVTEVREDMVADTEASGGTATLAVGPFGTEIRRVLPVEGEKGERLLHVSRTWLVQGPRWLLRGALVGKAGQNSELQGVTLELYEFFANTVVRRGDQALAAGDLVAMQLPEGVAEQ